MTTLPKVRHSFSARARALVVALVAVALSIGGFSAPSAVPRASALTFDAVTTGPLLRIGTALLPLITGSSSITTPDIPVLGPVTINLSGTGSNPVNLYNKINDFPFGGFFAGSFFRQPGGIIGTALNIASGPAAGNAVRAYEALLASAGGNTSEGYTPLTASGRVNVATGNSCTGGIGCIQGTNVTNLASILFNDWGTPNGGILTRLGGIFKFFGVDLSRPGGSSASSTGIAVNVATVGLGWGYSAFSDAPVNLNPVSWLNTVLATLLPTNLLGGIDIGGDNAVTLATRIAALATAGTSSTSYSTLVPKDLPLLEPLRLPSRIINFVLGRLGVKAKLGTPLADALQPALQILSNLGYTDVKPPSEGGLYQRTYDLSSQYTPFLSKAVLTPKQWLQVPGDVIRALIVGFQDAFPILRFGGPAPHLVVDGNHLAISYIPGPVAGTPSATTPAPTATATVAASTVKVAAATSVRKQAPVAAVPNSKKKAANSVAASSVSDPKLGSDGNKSSDDKSADTKSKPAKLSHHKQQDSDSSGSTKSSAGVKSAK